MKYRSTWMRVLLTACFVFSMPALAQEKKGEKLDVESVKKRYWAQGDESEMSVVQNRTYSKANRFEIEAFGQTMSGDPFLNMKGVGGLIGYHFNEYLGINAMYWKTFASLNSAADAFLEKASVAPDTNEPDSFFGGEITYSPIYGKLSLIGKAIIYYDLHVMLGAGSIKTRNGSYISPVIGIGQQVYLSQHVVLKFDYRLLRFTEDIVSRQTGLLALTRTNWTDTISLGVSVLIP